MTNARLQRLMRPLELNAQTPETARSSTHRMPLRLLAVAASLLALGGCATQSPVAAQLPPPELVPPPLRAEVAPVAPVSTSLTHEAAVVAASPEMPLSQGNTALPVSTVIEIIGSSAEDQTPTIGQPVDPLDPQGRPIDLTAQDSDLWQRVRGGFALPDLRGDLVRDHERWYASRPDYVQRMTDRGSRYLYHVIEEVTRRGMPTELALLPFIESAFNPQAQSVAKASGMWQFIPSTGRNFDLKQNVFRDDRLDVLASTRAALDYLTRLNRMFDGDWQLALAAYNWGEGNVRKAITRNQRRGLPTDYENLAMPAETRNYLPKLQAVKNIVLSPDSYGLSLPALQNRPYFVSVPIQRDIDTALAAQMAGLSLEEFGELNPSMKKPVILAAGTPQVLLPYDNAGQFVRRLSGHTGAMSSWTAWVVPRTMKAAEAAHQVGMDESQLRDINRIPARMLIRAGSTLLVARSHQHEADVSEHLADNAQISLAAEGGNLQRRTIRASRNDTLASLARKHRVTPAQLAQWNRGITPNSRFSAGQALVIYQAVASSGNAARVASSSRQKLAAAKTTRVASRKPVQRPLARRTARAD
ncbi:MAG: hypothetical protein RJA44_962 [Pseudomonadota bacterium]